MVCPIRYFVTMLMICCYRSKDSTNSMALLYNLAQSDFSLHPDLIYSEIYFGLSSRSEGIFIKTCMSPVRRGREGSGSEGIGIGNCCCIRRNKAQRRMCFMARGDVGALI